MSRTVDEKRPRELFGKIIRHAARHGLAALSLRPLAKAVGASPRVLLYHFGSKEQLVHLVFSELRSRQWGVLSNIQAQTLDEALRVAWKQMIKPGSLVWFRLFFQAYGEAMQRPKEFNEFLRTMTDDWLLWFAKSLEAQSNTPRDTAVLATAILAGFRGFLMDYCATKDRVRVNRAVEMWIADVSPMAVENRN